MRADKKVSYLELRSEHRYALRCTSSWLLFCTCAQVRSRRKPLHMTDERVVGQGGVAHSLENPSMHVVQHLDRLFVARHQDEAAGQIGQRSRCSGQAAALTACGSNDPTWKAGTRARHGRTEKTAARIPVCNTDCVSDPRASLGTIAYWDSSWGKFST